MPLPEVAERSTVNQLAHRSGVSMVMRGKWLRLVACVSLGAFLAANAYAGMASAAHFRLTSPPTDTTCPKPDDEQHALADDCDCESCCHHAETPRSREHAPCCPDCPKGPCSPECPCPGGCALCSIAKVPCLLASPCFSSRGPCLEDSLTEAPSAYAPPFSGTLTRPPRA